jgi:hypothetical protein
MPTRLWFVSPPLTNGEISRTTPLAFSASETVEKGWHFAVPPPLLRDWKRKKKTTALFSENQTGQSEKCPSETSLQYKEFRNPKKLFTAPCTSGYEEKSTKKQLSAPCMYALWTPTQHHGSTTALKERKVKP